jgi:ABC-2 type transport system ATP-binding protein
MSANPGFAIEARGLRRRFGSVTAIDGLDLNVSSGDVFGLVGPDGAGKTTTIRILCAIMDPSDGWARVAGYDTMRQPGQVKHSIGYMAQRFNLYGDLSVAENLQFFAELFQVPRRIRRTREERLLEFARLGEFRKRRAAQLSGGMQKKLALACSLIHQPQIILLDEPTTGVDPVSRREFWDILTELHLEGTTVLVSTPYMDEAERCSRVGLLYRGKLIICDTPERIKAKLVGEMFELRAKPLKRAEEAAAPVEGVLEVQTYGDLLHIFVDSAAVREESLRGALQRAGVDVIGLRLTRPRMEEAFVSIVRRQTAMERAGPEESG